MSFRVRSAIQAVAGVAAALLLGTACGDDKSAATEAKSAVVDTPPSA